MAMGSRSRVIILTIFLALGARAETIEGTVVIKKQLTKRRVTAAVPLYQRGQGVAWPPTRKTTLSPRSVRV